VSPHIVHFFDSNFFVGLVTLVVGSFAILLYYRQKRDFKKRAAQVVLLEIQNAEKRLKEARARLDTSESAGRKELPERLYVMPSDSWDTYNHLFVRNFLPNEWEAINDFYSKCALFDEAIRHNDGRFGREEQEIRRNAHQATYEYARAYHDQIAKATDDKQKSEFEEEFIKGRNNLVYLLTTAKFIFTYTPVKQLQNVERLLETIDMDLSLSAVGTKLQKLSRGNSWIC
jgi:hypothetical protein